VNKKLFGDYFGGWFPGCFVFTISSRAERAYVRINDETRLESRLGEPRNRKSRIACPNSSLKTIIQ